MMTVGVIKHVLQHSYFKALVFFIDKLRKRNMCNQLTCTKRVYGINVIIETLSVKRKHVDVNYLKPMFTNDGANLAL